MAPSREELSGMAEEGFIIQRALLSWFQQAFSWPDVCPDSRAKGPKDSATALSEIYYHAISIFLSGIFDYRSHWNEMPNPALAMSVIENHVSAILTCTEIALQTTNVAGALFLFPLRVAGARVGSSVQKEAIIMMLRAISTGNFVVAGAFVEDLTQLWARQLPRTAGSL